MDEIYYIIAIDARPWKKSPKLGAVIPLVLFFASVQTFIKQFLDIQDLSNTKKYFVILLLAATGMYLSKCLKRSWRREYTKRLMMNLVYLGLISTAFYNALAQSSTIRGWIEFQKNESILTLGNSSLAKLLDADQLWCVLIVVIVCLIGTLYLVLQTSLHLRAEADKLKHRKFIHTFFHYRAKETRSLTLMYFIYFICSVCVISFVIA